MGTAELKPMSNAQMDQVRGQAGVSLGVMDASFYVQQEYVRYQDTDTGSELQLNGIKASDGQNGPVTLRVGDVDTNGDGIMSPLMIDVFANPDGYGVFGFMAPDWDQKLAFEVDELVFCNTPMGRLEMGRIDVPSWRFLSSGHGDGVDMGLDLAMNVDEFAYTYREDDPATTDQNEAEALTFSGIELARTFTANTADDPADPSTWQSEGRFRIGDMNVDGASTYDPATFDVGVDPDTNLAQVVMSLPMQGSLRVKSLEMGDQGFGPMAIDGIQVHRMKVRFIP
jgi:hypothetical protein